MPENTIPLGVKIFMPISLVFIAIGSALLWSLTGSVTNDAHAKRAAEYYIVGFFYIFVTALLILITRKSHRAASSALYLVLAGLVFEVITRNQMISWAYCNMWRLYSEDATRMTHHPTSTEKTAVKSMLAGCIMGHFGVVCAVISAIYTPDFKLSIRGTYMSLLGWVFAIPGAICLFCSHSATLETVNSNTAVYQTTWLILDSALGIMTIQTAGVLFDNFELVAAAAVISGTNGLFLLGDTFLLQYQRSLAPEYDGDGPIIYAGGVLCWLSIFVALWGALHYFSKRHIVYYNQLPAKD